MSRSALLVVDVQKDFCPGGALAVPEGDEVVQPLNQVIRYARENGWPILVSRDWHPRVTAHFAEFGGKWPVHCVQNTPGVEFHRDLQVEGAIIISKGTQVDEDGYSPFDGHAEDGRTVEEILRNAGVERIYVGGLATDYCVKAAVLHALEKGFEVYLLFDACMGVEGSTTMEALREIIEAGAVFTHTSVFGGGE